MVELDPFRVDKSSLDGQSPSRRLSMCGVKTNDGVLWGAPGGGGINSEADMMMIDDDDDDSL
jgi:hypothetical protein